VGYCGDYDYSKDMRYHLTKRLAAHFKKEQANFDILKTDEGIPYVQSIFNLEMPDISFSHDGGYYSYAMLL
jgi:hypothetical protein